MAHHSGMIACLLAVFVSAEGACMARSRAVAPEHAFFHENVMGTSLDLRVRADDPEAARWAEERVLGEIDRLSLIFSSHDGTSEFRRWQAVPAGPVRVSAELIEMLTACDGWRDRSGGAFDPRVEGLSRVWSSAAARDRLPSASELASARALMDHPAWRLDVAGAMAEGLSDGPLTLNAIAKGYIVERAASAALSPGRGVRGLVLNVGGDFRVCGEVTATLGLVNPQADSESAEPMALIAVKDRAVATSGRSQRGYRIGGRWYSHIIDPRTGLTAEDVAAATVIAPRSADADALATICCVLTPKESVRLVATVPDAECLIVDRRGRMIHTAGWSRYETAPDRFSASGATAATRTPAAQNLAPAIADGPAAEKVWRSDFEFAIDFEIKAPDGEGRRYRRPYVAIWVENQDGFLVRNLTLWVSMGGAGPFQWLPDLKRWYRADQARKEIEKKDLFFTLARPTRPPGKYRVVWDGKDTQGKLVPGGEYTILIDAVREHGTYQHIRKKLKVDGKPFREEIVGDVEIKAATIEYRRKDSSGPQE